MCGIAGFLGRPLASVLPRVILERMIGAIAYRGPDAQGFYLDDQIGLAHARLSIIDLATGQQPMANADGTIWITFNGEIFNYVELRADLIARGHRFRTDSDTEVILQLYEEKGPDCVDDVQRRFRVRDLGQRAGTSSCWRATAWACGRCSTRGARGCLFFASEVKALLEAPGVERRARPRRARPDFHVLVPARAAHAVQGHLSSCRRPTC